jgi:hypothetical protein
MAMLQVTGLSAILFTGVPLKMRYWVLLLCTIFAGILSAQVAPQSQESLSCQRFAQQFYDWYVPFTQKQLSGPASDVALQRKPTVFSLNLLHALRTDSEAQTRAKGELVGLDFDPFLGSQDPADRYEARHATVNGGTCSIGVWRVGQKLAAAFAAKNVTRFALRDVTALVEPG